MKSIQLVTWGIVLGLFVATSSYADRRDRGHQSRSALPTTPSAASRVTAYLLDELKVEDPSEYNLTLQMEARVERMSEEAKRQLEQFFSTQSAHTIGEIFRAFGRTSYNNAIVLGPAGTGKSFLTDQLTLLFSMGIVPEFLKPELGMGDDGERFRTLRDAFLANTDIVTVNIDLLSQDNTRSGRAFSSEEIRMRTILTGLFRAAKEEYQRRDSGGNRIGRRTVFVFDEVATLPELVQATLKKILDGGGFHDPADPVRGERDPGYSVIAMTTPDEYRDMVRGDSAVDRRYHKVLLSEPTEEEAFRIVQNQVLLEWSSLYNVMISDDAIRFIIRMRRFLDTPPLAMPASVLKATNDLMLSPRGGSVTELTLRDAQEFVMRRVGLTDVWFEGPNGEPPFHQFAELVNQRVVGQEEVVGRIADRLKAWARLGFGGDLPVFFLGGSSGSGKDTLVKAINEVMFGHDGRHLMFSIGGIGGFGINAIIEGPPRGNHADDESPLLVQALDNGPRTGIIVFNEGKDAPSDQLEKLKVFIESGEIRPRGRDSRVRPLMFPIFVLGQWGEEAFDGRSDTEIAATVARLSQAQIEQFFTEGQNGGETGAVSRALLNRAKKSGGVFLLAPVPQRRYPDVISISLRPLISRLSINSNITLTVTPAIIDLIARTSIEAGEGTRGLGATMIDFTETALSMAMDDGLPMRNVAVTIEHERVGGRDYVIVRNGVRIHRFEAARLRRIKMVCESQML